MEFLFEFHQDGKSYSVINTYKSSILQTLLILGNNWCNNPAFIGRFMKGIFLNKPPMPKYKFTWDVSIVIKCLEGWSPLDKLDLKHLTYKLVGLIALSIAPRAQTLKSLNLEFMKVHENNVVFYFPNLLKTSHLSKSRQFSVKLEHFQNENLCVFHTLLHYINITKELRNNSQLFISYVTFNAVTCSTLARWLKCVLDIAGIDTNVFKAHSFRSASVSAASKGCCSIKNILDTAGWNSDHNFFKYYHRSVIDQNDVSFVTAVLNY